MKRWDGRETLVGRSRDTGGPKRCGTCGIVRSAQSADRAVR